MKNILAHSTARAAVALAIVLGGLTTFTNAADIGTANLQLPVAVQTGKPKVIGAVLARPVLAKGDVAASVSAVNQFTAVNTSTDLTAFVPVSTAISGWAGDWNLAPASDNHYIVEFTSGPNTGLIKRVTAFGASGLVTVDGNLPAIDAGTRFVVRKDHTLASLFGDQTSATASGIIAGSSAGSSDQFGIFDSTGKIIRFFLRSATGWKDIADRTGVNRNFVRVSMGTGVLMTPITTKNIYLNGEYRGTRSKITVSAVNSFLPILILSQLHWITLVWQITSPKPVRQDRPMRFALWRAESLLTTSRTAARSGNYRRREQVLRRAPKRSLQGKVLPLKRWVLLL